MSELTKAEFNRAKQLLSDGKYDEVHQIVERLEKKEELTPRDRFKCQLLRANLLMHLGQYKEALALAKSLYERNQELGATLQEVDALIVIASALRYLGRLDESYEIITQGERVLQALTSRSPSAITQRTVNLINCKAVIYEWKGELDRALEYAKQSLALQEETGNNQDIVTTINILGSIYYNKGDLNQALEYYQQNLILLEKSSNKIMRGRCLSNIGNVYYVQGHFDQALEYYQRALPVNQEAGHEFYISYSLHNIGLVYSRKGDLDQALEYFQQSLVLRKKLGLKLEMAECFSSIGIIYSRKGDLDQSLAYYQQSLSLLKEVGNKQRLAWCLNNISMIYMNKGELNEALEYIKQVLVIQKESGNKLEIANSLDTMGLIYYTKGDLDQALKFLERSLEFFEEMGNNFYISELLLSLIQVNLDKNMLDQAQQYLLHLQAINTQEDNKVIDQHSRIAKALVLKSSTQAQNQTQAKELLQQLADEEVVDHRLTVLVLLNVCDMLLAELEISNVQEQLQVVQTYVNKLLAIAQHQNSHWLLASTYVLRARVIFIELRHLWSFEKLQELNTTLQQIQQWAQAKQLFIILAQAHLLLALFYHTRLFFDEVKAELKKAEAIIDQRNLFNERQKLEKVSQQIQTSKATYLAMLTQGFEQEQHKLKIAEFEQDFMNTIDAYLQVVKATISTLVNK